MRARQLLAEKPHLAKANIYTAAAVGDFAAVADFLAKGADVHAKGGPFDWEPLLYAAYSRLDSEAEGHSTLEVARLLLEAGADPNAGFLWDWGGQFPCLFTALTGVLGLGEAGPPIETQHQHWYEFARLLLEAGADPNDNQGLYNRMQYPDDEHLKLLLEYGLGKGQGGPWFKRFFQRWPLPPPTSSPPAMCRAARRTFSRISCVGRLGRTLLTASSCSSRTAPTSKASASARKTALQRWPTILSPRERR